MNAVATREAKKIRVDISGQATLLQGPEAHLGITDLRWAPTFLKQHEFNNSKGKFPVIEIDRVWMNTQFRESLSQELQKDPDSYLFETQEGTVESYLLSVNTALCLLDHYGFEADYDPVFLARFSPFMGQLFLHGYKVEGTGKAIADRHFHGVTYERETFKEKLNELFGKHDL